MSAETATVAHPTEEVTRQVLRAFGGVEDPRTRHLLLEAISAAHAYARRVGLTTPELMAATGFLTRVGQASDDVRKEFVLLSDTTGLTMVVDGLADSPGGGALETSALGPFHRPDAPALPDGATLGRLGVDGEPMRVSLEVVDGDGRPVPDASLEIWLAAENGLYENQDPAQPDMNLRGRFRSRPDGRVGFTTIRPAGYLIPDDGPVGELLRLAHRGHHRPAHVHVVVTAPGFRPVTSALYLAGDRHIDDDAVYGVKDSLVVECRPGDQEGGVPSWSLRHRLVIERAEPRGR